MTTYLFKNKIKNVRDVIINKDLFILTTNLALKNLTMDKSIQIDSTDIYTYSDFICTTGDDYYNFQLEKEVFNTSKNCYFHNKSHKNMVVLNTESSFIFYDFKKQKAINELEHHKISGFGLSSLIDNENILCSGSSKICLFNITTQKPLWTYSVEDYFNSPAQIMEGRILAISGRVVFFAHTHDWEAYATFVLDAQTGELLNNPQETIFGGKLYLFDGFIWQKKDKGFAKMNPKTLEITHYDLSEQLPTERIENITMAYHKGVIAVSAHSASDTIRSMIILFDTKTEKIIWKKELLQDDSKPADNENRCQIEQIQMNDTLIAVSVQGYDLYIFEKKTM